MSWITPSPETIIKKKMEDYAEKMKEDFKAANEAMAARKFKVGDVVRLKSGGQWMTVMGYSPQPVFTKMDVVCDWHNPVGDNQHNYYHEDQLELKEVNPVIFSEKVLTPIEIEEIKKDWRQRQSATIERCALVAETWKQGGSTESSGIATAIRKLKDAP